jgi:hypothetical protein
MTRSNGSPAATRASAHARTGERGQIEFDQLQAASVGRLGAHRFGGPARLVQIPRRAADPGPVRRQRSGGFHAQPGRNAGDQNPLAAQVNAFEHLVGGRCCAKGSSHGFLHHWGCS